MSKLTWASFTNAVAGISEDTPENPLPYLFVETLERNRHENSWRRSVLNSVLDTVRFDYNWARSVRDPSRRLANASLFYRLYSLVVARGCYV